MKDEYFEIQSKTNDGKWMPYSGSYETLAEALIELDLECVLHSTPCCIDKKLFFRVVKTTRSEMETKRVVSKEIVDAYEEWRKKLAEGAEVNARIEVAHSKFTDLCSEAGVDIAYAETEAWWILRKSKKQGEL